MIYFRFDVQELRHDKLIRCSGYINMSLTTGKHAVQ